MKVKRIVMAIAVLIIVLAMACALVSCDLFGGGSSGGGGSDKDTTYEVTLECDSSKGSVSGGGKFKQGDSVTIIATANEGYSFVGWYDGETKVSDQAEWTFSLGEKPISYTAKFSVNSYTVNLDCDILKGSVTGGGNYEYGSSVTISATANTGYSFVGWYDGENVISTDAEYTFILGDDNIAWTAKFGINKYIVKLGCVTEQGTVTGGGEFAYGSSLTITAKAKDGYKFIGWYDGETLVSKEINYTFTCTNDTNYSAKFEKLNLVQISCDSSQGSVTGGGEFNNGESVTITATARTGYSFVGWYNGETLVSSEARYTFVMGSNGVNYTAKFKANQYSLTLECNSEQGTVTGSGEYAYGSSVTITATPNTGYSFVGWYDGENVISTDAEYTFILGDDNIAWTAKFGINKYIVKLGCVTEQGTVTGGGEFAYGSSLTITAKAKDGYKFIGWYDGETLVSKEINYTFTCTNDTNFTAKFEKLNLVQISFDSSQGSVTGGGEFNNGESVTITAKARAGYSFVGWYDGETLVSSEGRYTFVMGSNGVNYTAKFKANQYSLTLECNSEQGTVTGSGEYAYGSSVTITATPNTGYSFIGWYDGENVISTDAEYTFILGDDNIAWTAKFGINKYIVKLGCVTEQGTVTGGGEYAYGSSVTITATEKVGYIFDAWYDGAKKISEQANYTFTMVAKNVTYTAKYTTDSNYEKLELFLLDDGTYKITGVTDSSIRNIKIPNYVSIIGEYAFYNCSGLTSINIPDSVTSIGFSAFSGCSKISEVKYNGTIEQWLAISGLDNLMDNGSKKKLYIGGNELTKLVIPDSVTSIGSYAFEGCSSLTSVTIPDSVTSIGSHAFEGCRSLTSITIPNSVTSIGSHAFEGCRSLTSITIPNSVTSIGEYAFINCSSLTSVTIGNSVISIGDYAFKDCWSLTSVTIPNSVTSIGGRAFSDCSNLVSITIPDSVTSIGDYAFSKCWSLTSVTIPNSVTSIGWDAFDYCNKISIVHYTGTIEQWLNISGLDNLMEYGFNKKLYISGNELTKLVIPDSVTSIGNNAFEGCSSLTSITIPDSVTSIGNNAFEGCSSLTSVTIPNSVTSIGDWAFSGCSSLTSVTIPNGVTSIGEYAFYNCSSLTSVTFENTTGWFVSESSYATSGTDVTVIDPSQNAEYLKDTYYNYYWKRK